MAASITLKRLGIAVVVAAAATFGVLLATNVLIPADKVREAVKDEIRAVTGLDLLLRGNVSVSLFPSGSVSFSDVVLGELSDGRPALSVDVLTARLRFFPLLTGNIEIADVALKRPRIFVTIDSNGRSNWSGLTAALTRAVKPDAARANSFSEIRITDGTILLNDQKHHIDERIENVGLSLAWPSISRSFAATGRLNWRGETMTTTLSIGDFLAALTGARSGLKLRFSGTPLNFAFDGHVSYKPTLKIEGSLNADSDSLRKALRWAGRKPLPGGGFDRFAIKAQTNVAGGTISLSSVNIELDGNAAEGALKYVTDGRRVLQGTLAADSIDLTPYVSTVQLLTANERGWNGTPIALDSMTDFEFDLRLSAAKVKIANATLGRTAVASNLRDGRLTVTVGESQAFGGVIKGHVGLANSTQGATFKSQLQFSDVNLQTCLGQIFGLYRVDGKGNLGFTIEGSGKSVLEITQTLNGQATLASLNGALTGVDVEQLLRRLERRPLSARNAFRSGRTPYDKLAITLKISQGTATIEELKVESSAIVLALSGSASIPTRDLDIKGIASLTSAEKPGTAPFELPFAVAGSWHDPYTRLDIQSLIRRSGAAAPLLDAVRSHRAREAVRNAIDRLKSKTAKPAAEPPAEATATAQPAATEPAKPQ